MTQKQFAALMGFAFAAAWISFNFGYALLCLVAAGGFYAAASFLQGELDLGELQDRFVAQRPGSPPPPPPPPSRPRVQ
ncbi:MAG: hypothetical protein M3Z33_05280 [Actinomycetota bacterium]|nr:hypothetical protein [Actinomycetota bacterium]